MNDLLKCIIFSIHFCEHSCEYHARLQLLQDTIKECGGFSDCYAVLGGISAFFPWVHGQSPLPAGQWSIVKGLILDIGLAHFT